MSMFARRLLLACGLACASACSPPVSDDGVELRGLARQFADEVARGNFAAAYARLTAEYRARIPEEQVARALEANATVKGELHLVRFVIIESATYWQGAWSDREAVFHFARSKGDWAIAEVTLAGRPLLP
jgi:hypothetical protein